MKTAGDSPIAPTGRLVGKKVDGNAIIRYIKRQASNSYYSEDQL